MGQVVSEIQFDKIQRLIEARRRAKARRLVTGGPAGRRASSAATTLRPRVCRLVAGASVWCAGRQLQKIGRDLLDRP